MTEVSVNDTEVLNAKNIIKYNSFFIDCSIALLCMSPEMPSPVFKQTINAAINADDSSMTDQSKPNLMDFVWTWGQGFTSL